MSVHSCMVYIDRTTAEEIISQHLPISPPRDLLPESVEEKLVCYADKFFSKSHPDDGPRSMEEP